MLRYQPAIGPSVDSQITRYLSLPACPTYLGFDPRLQVVHERDGLDALAAAVARPVRGAVNVAGDGHDRPDADDQAGAPAAAAAAPVRCSARSRRPPGASAWRRCRRTSGGCCATAAAWTLTRLVREVGFRPRFSTEAAVHDWARHRAPGWRSRRRSGAGGRMSTHARRGTAAAAAPAAGPAAARDAARGVGTAIAFMRRLREGLEAGVGPAGGASAAAPRLSRARATEALRLGAAGGSRATTRRTSGASTRSSWTSCSRCSSSSTTAGGGSRSRAPGACPPTAARCWWPTTRASCPGTRR